MNSIPRTPQKIPDESLKKNKIRQLIYSCVKGTKNFLKNNNLLFNQTYYFIKNSLCILLILQFRKIEVSAIQHTIRQKEDKRCQKKKMNVPA